MRFEDLFTASLVSGILGGFVGAFLGGFARFFWDRWLPDVMTWRREQGQARRKVLATFRDPMLRAADDFQSRLYNLIRLGGLDFMDHTAGTEYGTNSTLFVAAQYLGWSELLRRNIRALDYADLASALDAVTSALASSGSGIRVFRLQQREIGERMLVRDGSTERVMIYTEFVDELASNPSGPLARSLQPIRATIESLRKVPEDRRDGLRPTQHALIDLLQRLNRGDSAWKYVATLDRA